MRKHVQAFTVCLISAGCAAALAAPAQADWSETGTLEGFEANAVWPDAAMNARGDAAIAWVSANHDAIDVSLRPAGGTFGAPLKVSKDGEIASTPSVAIDPDGNAIVVFPSGHHDNPPLENGVKATFVSASGDVVGPLKIGSSFTGGVRASGLGMDAAGNAIAWWESVDDDQLVFAVRRAGEGFGEPEPIPNPEGDLRRSGFAVGEGGEAVAAWASRTRVYAAIGGVDSEFGPAKLLTGPIQSVMQPRVAVAPDGSAIVAWVDRPDEGFSGFVRVAYRPAGGEFGPPQTVGEVFYTGVHDVSVAMGPDGEAMVAWGGGTWVPRTEWLTTFVTRPPGGPFGAPREGMRASCDEPPQIAYDSAGNTYAMCRHYYGYELTQPLGVAFTAARPAGAASFGPVKQLTPEGLNVWEPVVAAGGPGQAVAAWPRGWFPFWFGLEFATHEGSVFAPPPELPELSGPPGGARAPAQGDPATGAAAQPPAAGSAARSTLTDLLARLGSRSPKGLLRRLRQGPLRVRVDMPGAGALGARVLLGKHVLAQGRVTVDRAGPAAVVLRATPKGRRAAVRGDDPAKLAVAATVRLEAGRSTVRTYVRALRRAPLSLGLLVPRRGFASG